MVPYGAHGAEPRLLTQTELGSAPAILPNERQATPTNPSIAVDLIAVSNRDRQIDQSEFRHSTSQVVVASVS